MLKEILRSRGSAFTIEKTQDFMDKIRCYRLSASTIDKSDITMKIVDVNTGYSPTVGFSIKSELGSSPTLLNAGRTTNFIYKIIHNYSNLLKETNEIYRVSGGRNHTDVRRRIEKITQVKGELEFYKMQNQTFNDNLILLTALWINYWRKSLYFYRDGINNCWIWLKNLNVKSHELRKC